MSSPSNSVPPLPECSSCTECGIVSSTPTTLVKSNISYLTQCGTCDCSMDRFVQFDPILLTLNIILTRSSAFIHVAHNRLKNIGTIKLLTCITLWLLLTTFSFSAGLSQNYLGTLILPTNAPLQHQNMSNDTIQHALHPHYASHNPILLHFQQNIPRSFIFPPHFTTLASIDFLCLAILFTTFPFFLQLRFSSYTRTQDPNKSTINQVRPPSYLQSVLLLVKFFTPSLLSRGFAMLALVFALEPVYYAFLLIFVYTGLFVSITLYYHTICGYYGIHPNLHKIDIISVFPHAIPVLYTMIAFFLPLFYFFQLFASDLSATLPSISEAITYVFE